MNDQIERLAWSVSRRLKQLGFTSPSRLILQEIFQVVFLASLKTEESRFVTGSITFANPQQPDPTPPSLRRADYPGFVPFECNQRFTVESVVRLSRAIDKWSGSITIYGTRKSQLVIWGLLDQQVQHNIGLNREAHMGFSPPGILTVTMNGVADFKVYHGAIFLGGLAGNRLITKENDAFLSQMLTKQIKPDLLPFARAIANALNKPTIIKEAQDSLYYLWADSIARLCIGLRRNAMGGSFLLTPAPQDELLQIKNKVNYNRLGDSIVLKALDDQYQFELSRDLHNYEHEMRCFRFPGQSSVLFLGRVLGFKLGWGDVSQRGMQTLDVVVANVTGQFPQRLGARPILDQFQFRLDRPEARFHERVVVTVPRGAHALTHACSPQHGSISTGRVLAAPVGVMNQTRCRLSLSDRPRQRAQHQRVIDHEVVTPADDPPREQVHQQRQISKAAL